MQYHKNDYWKMIRLDMIEATQLVCIQNLLTNLMNDFYGKQFNYAPVCFSFTLMIIILNDFIINIEYIFKKQTSTR